MNTPNDGCALGDTGTRDEVRALYACPGAAVPVVGNALRVIISSSGGCEKVACASEISPLLDFAPVLDGNIVRDADVGSPGNLPRRSGAGRSSKLFRLPRGALRACLGCLPVGQSQGLWPGEPTGAD